MKLKTEAADLPLAPEPAASTAVRTTSPLAAALAQAGAVLTQEDYDDGGKEAPVVRYLQVRQKDLKGDDGKVVREAGPFRTGKVTDLAYEDRRDLNITVLVFRPNRVYFEKLGDAKPACRSMDMVRGSREREGNKYGLCASCWLAQWGSAEGGRQACREVRKIYGFDWATEKPVVLTLGPSSLKPWMVYNDYVDSAAAPLRRNGKIPFIHHLMMVRVETEYRAEPAGHYVVKFGEPVPLPMDVQEQMARFRQMAASKFQAAIEAREEEAEDYVGGGERA